MNRSNQQMLKSYKAERRQEERNDVVQQAELYEQLAKERGLDQQATALARLAKNVFKKSFDVLPQATKSGLTEIKDLLVKSVEDKTFANVLKGLLAIPKSELNARQKVIQKDLANPEFKKTLNEVAADNLDKNAEEFVDTMTEAIAGDEGKADFDDMIRKSQAIKARSGSLGSLSDISTSSNAKTYISSMIEEQGKLTKENIKSMTVGSIKDWFEENNWKLSGNFPGKDSNKVLSYRKQLREKLISEGLYAD